MRRISAREEGFTLLEVVTVTGLLMVVVASILGIVQVVQRASVRQGARSEAIDQVRVAMERITKDVRQATDVLSGSTTSYLDITTYVGGLETQVTYDATDGEQLIRVSDGTTITLLERLRSSTLFTYTPDATDPSVIAISLVIDPERFASDDDPIQLDSEVELRNR